MYKSKLQEYCQAKAWKLPEYSATKEGLDHCPQFKGTVIVNGSTFTTTEFAKTSKEAQNMVAKLAYDHLTGSLSANLTPVCNDVKPAMANAVSETAPAIGLNSKKDDKKFKEIMHLYKNQLQIYAQKRHLALPVYTSEREGPPHACRFKSKVTFEGKTYESPQQFSTLKDAENAAARVALMELSSDGVEEEDLGFFKNLLQEFAQREYSCLPEYETIRFGPPHMSRFVSTVEIREESFQGQEAMTKKQAEMSAAKIAYTALKERANQKTSESERNVVEVRGCTNIGQTKCIEPSSQSASTHAESSCGSGLDVNYEQLHETETSPPNHKKIRVYPRMPNMKLPPGTVVMHEDEKWVAVSSNPVHINK